MSLESDVASVLRKDPVGRICFRVALVDGRRMLARSGVALTWQDCDALRDAIKAHPAYRG